HVTSFLGAVALLLLRPQARAHDGRRRDGDERAGQRLGVHGAPAGRCDTIIEAAVYSSGQDNEFWLEAWNGNNFIVDRQDRPPVVVAYLLVGVTGAFQPDKLARAFQGDDDGMYARFCFAWPEEPAHMPLSNEVIEIEPDIQNMLTRIINLPSEEAGVFAPRTV